MRIIQDDMREAIRDIADQSIDLIVADPPYGETSLVWDNWPDGWPQILAPLFKPSGSMWVFGSMRLFMNHAGEFTDWKMSQDIVWEKHNGTGLFNDRYRRVHEHAVHFYPKAVPWSQIYVDPQHTMDAQKRTIRKKQRPAHWIGETGATVYKSEDGGPRLQRSVIYARSMHGRADHPTQKPEAILETIIKYACPEGGTVLDPFAGSGATGFVADRLKRAAILIEANPEYVDRIRDRMDHDLLANGIARAGAG